MTDERILIVEQPGAWGRDAVTDSSLSHAIVAPAVAAAGGPCRVLVARHATRPRLSGSRRWWTVLSGAEPSLSLAEPGLPGAGIICRSGEHPAHSALPTSIWTPAAQVVAPTVFVCTNGRRDACCAEFGRELLRTRTVERTGTVEEALWEISHIGGHRFAPTALRLPDATMWGRLTPSRLRDVLGGGPVDPAAARGRVGRSPQRQIAEVAVANLTGIPVGQLTSRQVPEDPEVEVMVIVRSLRQTWHVELNQEPVAARAKSCGSEPQPGIRWSVANIDSF